MAFARCCFASRLLCRNQSSLYCPPPPVLPALSQYYCMPIAQYAALPRPPLLHGIHYTILVMAISCKGQCARSSATVTGHQGRCPQLHTHQSIDRRSSQSHTINRSKVLTKPHTGRGEATSQRHLRGSKPCVAKRHRLGGLVVPTLHTQQVS